MSDDAELMITDEFITKNDLHFDSSAFQNHDHIGTSQHTCCEVTIMLWQLCYEADDSQFVTIRYWDSGLVEWTSHQYRYLLT